MELLNDCRNVAHKYFSELLLAAEKTLLDSLFQQADAATSNDEQRRYYDTMQQIKQRSAEMHTAFQEQLIIGFHNFGSAEGAAADSDDGLDINDLTLVNREELEDELAISVIVSKANSRNSEELWKLNRRMAVLRRGRPVTDEDNPFGPAQVGAALQAGVHSLSLDSKSRLIIYKHLGKVFIVAFGKLLQGLNKRLAANKILPNLRFSASGSQAEDTADSAQSPVADMIHSAQESAASIANQQQMVSAIRQLQAQTGPRTHTIGGVSLGGIATDGSNPKETFSDVDYALVLSAVQQSQAVLHAAALNKPLAAERVEAQVVEQLLKSANQDGRHKMAKGDADTVDLVGMVFRYILDDENLSDVVKSLLSHLHTPFLKLALMDKSFLDNYEHSARLLINSMAEVGGRWVESEHDRTVLPKLKIVVDTVLKGFIDDVTIFDRLLEDFQRFRENLEKRARMVEKRNTESQQGMERLELSRQRAEDEIIQRLLKGEVPETAVALLQRPWADFLAFNLLRHGDESITWRSALKVVDAVVWSVQKDQAVDNKEDFRRRQSEFEARIKEGLEAMSYGAEASHGLLNALREAQDLAYHAVVLDKPPATQRLGAAAPIPPQPAEAAASEAENNVATRAGSMAANKPKKPTRKTAIQRQAAKESVLTPEQQRAAESLRDIAFGTWFEFSAEGKREKLKLAWFSRVSGHYMFVNSAGVKQAVKSLAELAQGMVAGDIELVVLEKRSFMERALGAVLSRLKPRAA